MESRKVSMSSKTSNQPQGTNSVDFFSKRQPVKNQVPECSFYDRPGISSFHKPQGPSNALEVPASPASTLPKADFIKKWLMTAEIDRSESTLSSSNNSIVSVTPPRVKRQPPRSPLHQLNESKRPRVDPNPSNSPKNTLTKQRTSCSREDTRLLKENFKGLVSPKASETISGISSLLNPGESFDRMSLSPRSKLAVCRAVIFGEITPENIQEGQNREKSPWKVRQNSLGGLEPSLEAVISQCDSPPPKHLEIDSSSPSQTSEFPKILEVLSVGSPTKSGDVIECRSSDGNPLEEIMSPGGNSPGVTGEEVFSVESDDDCDKTIQDLIEDPGDFSQVGNRVRRLQEVSRIDSDDSDRTYYSQGDRGKINESEKISETLSNQVSNVKSNLTISDNSASAEASPSSRRNVPEIYPAMGQTTAKKIKAKKGSMLERFQTFLNGKISSLRMWRHQMAQDRFKGTCNQCVIMRIRKFAVSYGRPYFQGTVIKDSLNLLGKIIPSNISELSDPTASDASVGRTLTVLTIPEIVGQFNVKEKSTLKFYPPWEVIDANTLVLSVLYFILIPDDSDECQVDQGQSVRQVVTHEFDCPCLRAGQIVDSCRIKFTNSKPNAMDYFFK